MWSRITIDRMLALTVAGVSVVMDLYSMRISNTWLSFSLFSGFIFTCMQGGSGLGEFASGILLPLFLLGWLYWFHMLGAGDLKLFCALGGIMGARAVLYCILLSLIFGAAVSFGILVTCGGFRERYLYLLEYLNRYTKTGIRRPYYRKDPAWENFHFTIPVFMSVMFYAGGIY